MAEEKKTNTEEKKSKFKNIISIDFGSYGSTATFGFPHSDRDHVYPVKDWKGMRSLGNILDTTMQKKTLTALLWDIKKKEVKSIGYQALKEYDDYKKYQNMMKEGKNKGKTKMKSDFGDEDASLAYFDHFKPHLVGNNKLNKNKFISANGYDKNDRNAPKLSILDLITYYLIEIKKQSLKEAQKHRNDAGLDLEQNEELKEDEVLWVLGTPAVWDDSSRGAFKRCVVTAGMNHHNIGLEPEFVLFCIKYYDNVKYLTPGKKYVVLDCGAGTTDITCVEVTDSNKLMEVVARNGEPIGSFLIDKEYYKMLDNIFGKEFMTKFKIKHPDKWNKMKFKFWLSKHSLQSDTPTWNVEFIKGKTFEKELKKECEENDIKYDDDFDEYINSLCVLVSQDYLKNKCEENDIKYDITYDEGYLSLGMGIWQQFHDTLFAEICALLKRVLSDSKMRGCEDVIVCGGLSDSKCFQNKLSKEFPKIQFHSPNDASKSVSIGGLYRITRVNDLQDRRMWLTYGIEVTDFWDASEDDDTNKHRDINSPTGYSKHNVFDPILFKNDLYRENEKFRKEYIIPIAAGKLQLNVFSVNSEEGAYYTTDEDCYVTACFELPLTDTNMIKAVQQNRKLPVTIEFGMTMIRILVTINDEEHEMLIRVRKQSEMVKTEGNTLLSEGKYEEAIQKYTEAIEYGEENAVHYANRAAAYSHLNEWKEAASDARIATELDENYVKAWVRLGLALLRLEQYEEAKDAYSNAMERTDKNASNDKWKMYKNKVDECKQNIKNT